MLAIHTFKVTSTTSILSRRIQHNDGILVVNGLGVLPRLPLHVVVRTSEGGDDRSAIVLDLRDVDATVVCSKYELTPSLEAIDERMRRCLNRNLCPQEERECELIPIVLCG